MTRPKTSSASNPTPEPDHPRILVVAGGTPLRTMATERLTRAGYEVDLAVDDETGWQALSERHYDLLITDSAHPWSPQLEFRLQPGRTAAPTPALMVSGTSVVGVIDPSPQPASWFQAFLRLPGGRMRILQAVSLILGGRPGRKR